MSDSRHTPGPWTATLGYTPTVKAGDTLLAAPSARADDLGGRQLSELHANARLIAAAPDLLAACEEALRLLEDQRLYDATTDEMLRAAIHKAKGE